jgi:hypothetical protein
MNSPSLQLMLQRLEDPKQFNTILGTVPVKLSQVIECPPISQLVKAGATIQSLEACLAIEITKASNALTVGGNLRQGQSLEIAKDLIATYPHESLEDFCYCLRNGIKGKYNESGKLFRFDSVVINDWFAQYLEEKYQAIEDKLMAEKDQQYQAKANADYIELLKEAVEKSDNIGMQPVRKLTAREIREEGQEKRKFVPYPSISESELEKKLLHLEWIKQNFDSRTGDPLPTHLPEDEWMKKR